MAVNSGLIVIVSCIRNSSFKVNIIQSFVLIQGLYNNIISVNLNNKTES